MILVTRSLSDTLKSELLAGLKSGDIPEPHHTSSIIFDLRDSDNSPVDVPVDGVFLPGETLTAAVALADRNPTNPFHHRYHPDHTWYEDPLPSQIWDVTREVTLVLDAGGAEFEGEAGWGDSWIGATFEEVISGIHEYPIKVAGTVRFQHISRIGVLNGGE